jgi:hypothetical protein
MASWYYVVSKTREKSGPHDEAFVRAQEVQILDLLGRVDAVERELAFGRERHFLVAAQVLDLGREDEAQGGEVRRHLELVERLAVGLELEGAHFLGRAHALAVG